MHFSNLFSVAALSVLATTSAQSFLSARDVQDLALDARDLDFGGDYDLDARDLDFDDELYLDARDESNPYEELIARALEDDDFMDALYARTFGSSGTYSASVGPGNYGHSGPGILKTSEVSVKPFVPNFSYPKGHPKNPRSLERRTFGSSGTYSASVGQGNYGHSGPGILKTSEVSVKPFVPNFSYPKGHPKNPRSLERRTFGSSSTYHASAGQGNYGHSGAGILKTTEYSVKPFVPNFSYPKGHPKNP